MVGKRTDENVKIGAETKAAERGFKKLTNSGKAMVAAIGVAAVAAAGAAAKGAVGLFREQERAEIRLAPRVGSVRPVHGGIRKEAARHIE